MSVTLDMMEYSTPELAQAAYVTNADFSSIIDQQQTDFSAGTLAIGDGGGQEYRFVQSFQLSAALTVTKVDGYFTAITGSPTGQVTLRIETDNAGQPSGTLANANASVAASPSANSWVSFTFATPFVLSASTTYWIRYSCDNQANDNGWGLGYVTPTAYANGNMGRFLDGAWTNYADYDLLFKIYVQGEKYLQSYSESTIKTQGSYALKAVAAQTDSLNKTLTSTIGSPIDLTDQTQIKFDIYSNRTGSNIKIGIHDSGGTTTENTPNITSAGEWQTVTWDISAVSNANKDAIDQIIITQVNADSATTYYMDNIYGTVAAAGGARSWGIIIM